ncbi:N-acetyllactosaminide beta-1,3-N-acetylglucosaminyltransferase 2-like [Corythoichthys intestinalis]|uniref:N-acetyllactosaminide beta-1,3-N-acetylglucosaminyltransferase 2-like n=1 Tax=Corythoichthys intestinalis TaxID=161448 RepID=UPI0025A61DB3|nr:N-acetyllactosaminide beta-1,3-N-acetylglucosaminyltransferase 2-like [Corythoichthys intestinalis]XP_061793205.1 N-acetyllactosaminide beta-1,3-N-acetylglucosaminyltransferase 2-like [Nerophis lumbriciformis]
MAGCRWRRVCICLGSLCISLVLLFIYIAFTVCSNINSTGIKGTQGTQKSIHFVASGSYKTTNYASLPTTFWKENEEAFWNQLQLKLDRHFNPILDAQNARQVIHEKDFYDSILTRSFLEVTASDSMKRKFEQLPEQMQDFVSHMKQRDYPIILQPPSGTCGAGEPDEKMAPLVLLAIKSSEKNFENRQAIRQTWGKAGWVATHRRNSTEKREVGGYIRRVFLIGKDKKMKRSNDEKLSMLSMERGIYHDILQWDFNDTFFNLTLKDVLFWKWFSNYCSNTRFVFKGDDDIFVNIPNMITYLQDQLLVQHSERNMNDFMVGDVINAAFPNRLDESKYFVPETFFTGLYPAYAGGGGVVYSGHLAKRLNQISSSLHLFPIDDVFVGMCMARLNANPIHHPGFLTFDFPDKEEQEPCAYHTIFLVHKRSPKQIIELSANVTKTLKQCWNEPLRSSDKKKKGKRKKF